jgi:hypothetical protein
MSDAKVPGQISTGIRSGLTSLTLPNSNTANSYFPTIMASTRLEVFGGSKDGNTEWVKLLIYPWFVNYMQSNLNYNYILDYDDFELYFTTVSNALQLYYTMDSIYAYASNSETENKGMEYLRQVLSAQMNDDYMILRSRLEQCVFPPNMLHWIWWFYQNYSTGTLPGSTIIRNTFMGSFQNNMTTQAGVGWSFISNNLIKYYLNQLLNVSTLGVGPSLNQAMPQWRIGQLPASVPFGIYDTQFLTYWANQTVSAADATGLKYFPTVAQDDTVGDYITFDNFFRWCYSCNVRLERLK